MEDEYFENEPKKDRRDLDFPPEKCTSALKSRLKCSFCPASFDGYFSLVIHLKTGHKADIQIRCKICQKLFIKPMTFHKHLLNHVPGVTMELLDILDGGYEPDNKKTRQERRERRLLQEQQEENQKKITEASCDELNEQNCEQKDEKISGGPKSGKSRGKYKKTNEVTEKCTESKKEQTTGSKDKKTFLEPKSKHLREKQNEIKKQMSSKSRTKSLEELNGKNSSASKSLNLDEPTWKRRKISCSRCDENFKTENELAMHSVCHVRIDARINCSKCSNYFGRSEDYFPHSCLVSPEISSPPAPSFEVVPDSPDQPSSPISFQDSSPSSPPEFIDHGCSPCQPSSPVMSTEIRPDRIDTTGVASSYDLVPSPPLEIISDSAALPSSLICYEDCPPSPTLRTKSLQETLIEGCPITSKIALQNPLRNPAPLGNPIELQNVLLPPTVGPIEVPSDGLLIVEPSLPLFIYMPGKVPVIPEQPPEEHESSEDESSSCAIVIPKPNSPEPITTTAEDDPEFDQQVHEILGQLLDLRESYNCDWCKRKFTFKLEWVDHALTHKVPTDWLCRQCGDRFQNDDQLYIHIRQVHEDFQGARFFRNSVIHNGSKFKTHPLKCNLCPKTFSARWFYNKHRLSHPENRKKLCQYCDQTFPTFVEKMAHIAAVHKPKTPNYVTRTICEICGKSMQRHSMKKHMEEVHSDTMFMCEDCGKICKHQKALELHKLSHLPEKPVACKFCSFRCLTSAEKLHHMTHKHLGVDGFYEHNLRPGVETPFKCIQCDNEYTTQVALDEHRIFHGERTVHCSKCPWKCFTNYHLRAHAAAFHSSKNNYENALIPTPWYCKFCGECTPNRYRLCVHESKCPHRKSTHTTIQNNNPEPEDVDMDSSEHIRKVDKGWHCDLCKKTYKSKTDMRYHYRAVHTGTYRFVCEICGRGTNSKSNMNAHMRQHGGGYECPSCGERFKGRSDLEEHKEEEHGFASSAAARRRSGKSRIGRLKGQSIKDVKWLEALVELDGEEGYAAAVSSLNQN